MSRQTLEPNRAVYQEVIDTRVKSGDSAPVAKLVEIARRGQDAGAFDGVMTLVHNFWGETTALLIANELGVRNADIDGNVSSGYIVDPSRAGKAAPVERKIALDMVLASKNANRLLLPLVLGAEAERMDAAHDVALNETGRGQYTGHRQPGETAHPLDCTTYLLEVLERAFDAAGKPDIWRRVRSTMRAHTKGKALSGVHLQRALQDELGWVGVLHHASQCQSERTTPGPRARQRVLRREVVGTHP